ncbi:MAG: peptidoglycan DD-metalloendopeptidase family protein [Gallionellaceae bacterium]|nr:peptidoglycan DD-metalloendopeptidase family protein [Gallionellaceae bacterium]
MNRYFVLLLVGIVLAGCSSSGHHAPVAEHSDSARKNVAVAKVSSADTARKKGTHEKDWRPQVYVVQKGDTLFSIAFNHGLDYHELAELNGIKNPGAISIGQQIRLLPAGAAPAASPALIESKSIESLVKEQPKVVKYPYSDVALAQIDKVQEPAKSDAATLAKTESITKSEAKPDSAASNAEDDGEADALEWSMPTKGKVLAEFSESANRKGIDIGGKLGQPIIASAPGKVVYSGTGLRGYGKLVIIKHNKTYLSAYAHNDQVLVKEGQSVTRGQKIAEMGNTDADQVKLHFEVRRLGKPVDPAKYLPLDKS